MPIRYPVGAHKNDNQGGQNNASSTVSRRRCHGSVYLRRDRRHARAGVAVHQSANVATAARDHQFGDGQHQRGLRRTGVQPDHRPSGFLPCHRDPDPQLATPQSRSRSGCPQPVGMAGSSAPAAADSRASSPTTRSPAASGPVLPRPIAISAPGLPDATRCSAVRPAIWVILSRLRSAIRHRQRRACSGTPSGSRISATARST